MLILIRLLKWGMKLVWAKIYKSYVRKSRNMEWVLQIFRLNMIKIELISSIEVDKGNKDLQVHKHIVQHICKLSQVHYMHLNHLNLILLQIIKIWSHRLIINTTILVFIPQILKINKSLNCRRRQQNEELILLFNFEI